MLFLPNKEGLWILGGGEGGTLVATKWGNPLINVTCNGENGELAFIAVLRDVNQYCACSVFDQDRFLLFCKLQAL